MSPWKQCALAMYYWTTLPVRRRAAAQRAAEQTEPVQVLFYHRVADSQPNDWTIDTRTFAQQVQWLASHFDVVPLAEGQRRIATGKNSRPAVCITFDDGYADNCRFAIPLLLEKRLPFTYFVATDHVLLGKPFPHDVKAGMDLQPNNVDQLLQMVAAGVEIGAHSRSHADLGRIHSEAKLQDEIAGSKLALQRTLDTEIHYFAFPFGMPRNMSTAAFRSAVEAGYDGVCSAYGAYNLPGDDPFHLKRIHGDPETVRLKNWLTIDPCRQRATSVFDPGDYRSRGDGSDNRVQLLATAAGGSQST